MPSSARYKKLHTENNPKLKELLIRILEKMDEYETNIESLNAIINEKNEHSSIQNKLNIIQNDLNKFKNDDKKMNFEIDNLNEEIYHMDSKIIENNQYARRESLIISGIPDNIRQNDLEEKVIQILRSIG